MAKIPALVEFTFQWTKTVKHKYTVCQKVINTMSKNKAEKGERGVLRSWHFKEWRVGLTEKLTFQQKLEGYLV